MADSPSQATDAGCGSSGSFADDLQQLAAARAELARLEAEMHLGGLIRHGVKLGVCALVGLIGLSAVALVAINWLAARLAARTTISEVGWQLMIGLALIAAATVTAWLAARRWRRSTYWFAASRAQWQEDLAMLGEWLGRQQPEATELEPQEPADR